MEELHDVFQERLARLEAGEPLEACLAGLPENEAALLKMAARLSAINYPEWTAESVVAQRAKLLRAAKERNAMSSKASKVSPRWALPAALSGAAALALTCMLVAVVAAGFTWLRRSSLIPREVAVAATPQNGAPAQTIVVANPRTGALANVRGNVQVQDDGGVWTTVKTGQPITAGKRIRTGSLSSATLVFYDGSRTYLGPNTELRIDTLDAKATGGPRVIQLTQWAGDIEHDVAHSDDPASVYEVGTPSGSGTARGTSFHVLVTAVFVRFDVDEGAVAVVNLNITVIVVAGQSTTIPAGEPPGEPVFRVTGEGEVLQIGSSWNIAGQTFLTDDNTVIVGNPQVGDWVAVEGRLLPDGARLADRITLLHRALENKFAFTGIVDSIGADTWTISGITVHVDELTAIEDRIEAGDTVEVRGGIAQDGAFWASAISLVEDEEPGLPFEFTGVIAGMGESTWTISGISIAVDDDTEIEASLEEGDVVKVKGHILADGRWLAKSIKFAEEDENKFEIAGPVKSMDPWVVAGVEFETNDATEIDDGIDAGDRVKVKGRILEDGHWLAEEIKLVEEDQTLRFEFVGKVTGTSPWIIGGLTLAADEGTKIVGEITVGDFAKAKGKILPDGTLLAKEIKRLDTGLGCLNTSALVIQVGAGRVALLNGQTINLDDSVQIDGDLKPAAIVLIHFCIAEDGTIVIISVTVIFQFDALPIVTPTPDDGEKVTICHKPSGNNPQTITVSPSAVGAHLRHGDTLGPCDQQQNNNNNNDGGHSNDDDDDDDDDDD